MLPSCIKEAKTAAWHELCTPQLRPRSAITFCTKIGWQKGEKPILDLYGPSRDSYGAVHFYRIRLVETVPDGPAALAGRKEKLMT